MLTNREIESFWLNITNHATKADIEISTISHVPLPGDFNRVNAHISVIKNPFAHTSVVAPIGDCDGTRALTSSTAALENCVLATNAGLFNVTDGTCFGSVISDQHDVQINTIHHNVHFGVTSSGQFFVGYVDSLDPIYFDSNRSDTQGNYPWHFRQLVGGVLWLIRNGTNYLSTSLTEEDPSTQSTGTLQQFASITSARTMSVVSFVRFPPSISD